MLSWWITMTSAFSGRASSFPIFVGRRLLDRSFNFFNNFDFVVSSVFSYKTCLYIYWNTAALLGFLKLIETGATVLVLSPNTFLEKLQDFSNPAKVSISASNFYIRCGGFVSNFVLFRWYSFFKKVKIPRVRPDAIMFLDNLLPMHLGVECLRSRTLLISFFSFDSQIVPISSNVLFFQPWEGGFRLFSTNFSLFFYFLRPFLFISPNCRW